MTTKKQAAKPFTIPLKALADSAVKEVEFVNKCEPFQPLDCVFPSVAERDRALAMDNAPYDAINAANINVDAAFFIGYPALATLAQRVEYYNMAQVISEEVVRNWIQVKSKDDNAEVVKEMEELLVKYDIKRLIQKAVMQECEFGVAHIYIDIGEEGDELANPLVLDNRVVNQDTPLSFRTVDPTWIYPAMYNATNPLASDFYKPQRWFVMGQTVHETRFIDVVTRPVPDILKPSYNFGGVSLFQFMMPYVDDWVAMKRNVVAIVKTLRMRALKTDMEARLQEPGEFDKRIKMFTNYQDNKGIWALDTQEDLVQQQTSLSDLSSLLSSFQEQLCMPARTTNLKYLGSAPAGLNASGDAEIETWHETVSGIQEQFKPAIMSMMKLIMLAEFGEIHDDIYFDFKPLDEITEKEQAEINEIKVRTITGATDAQLFSTEQGGEAVAKIEGVGFDGVVPDVMDDELYQGNEKGFGNE